MRRSRLQVGLNRGVAGGELLLNVIEGLQVLLQHEDMFGPIVPRQGRDDLRFGRVTAIVPVLGEGVRIGATGHLSSSSSKGSHARLTSTGVPDG